MSRALLFTLTLGVLSNGELCASVSTEDYWIHHDSEGVLMWYPAETCRDEPEQKPGWFSWLCCCCTKSSSCGSVESIGESDPLLGDQQKCSDFQSDYAYFARSELPEEDSSQLPKDTVQDRLTDAGVRRLLEMERRSYSHRLEEQRREAQQRVEALELQHKQDIDSVKEGFAKEVKQAVTGVEQGYKQEIQRLTETLEQSKKETQQLVAELERKYRQETERLIAESEQRHRQEIQQLQGDISRLCEQAEAVKTSAPPEYESVGSEISSVGETEIDLNDILHRLTSMEEQLAQLASRPMALEDGEVETLQSTAAELQRAISGKADTAELHKLREDLVAAIAEINGFGMKVEKAGRNIITIAKTVKSLTALVRELKDQIPQK